MKDTDWVRVGAPLLEQDAEFLADQVRAAGFPVDLMRSDDASELESGKCYFVRVQARHLPLAREIRARNFTERKVIAAQASRQPWRWRKREAIGAGATTLGCVLGVPVALLFKGGALMAVMTGGAFSLIAALLTLVFTVSSGPPSAQPLSPGVAQTTGATRTEGTERRTGRKDS